MMNCPTVQQRILSLLKDDVCTWETLKNLGNVNDEGLGFTLGELLGLRQIWTEIWTIEENDIRVYGLERRKGLLPRASYQSRRAADQINTSH
jgi:hypothetical protein